jgi:DNA-binding SARP family transcriptional activator
VVCAGRQVWPRSGVSEIKPWELLLYLACQPAEGVSSEDAFEALWPDDDYAEAAAHRFRQLRYRLRRQLTDVPGAPETDGISLERGTLKLDPRIIHSDATEFLGLLRAARLDPGPEAITYLRQARALYTGDLLEGPDARRYTWLDERDTSGVLLREHFRRLFQQASTRLAELQVMAGQLESAVDVYRELTDIDPGDEDLWCALFRLQAQRGDRVALVREERRMREALTDLASRMDGADTEDMREPTRETAQEYARLLTTLREHSPEPAAV